MTKSLRIWDISALFRWWAPAHGCEESSKLLLQCGWSWGHKFDPVSQKLWSTAGIGGLIIGRICHLSREKLSLSSFRIHNNMTAGMKIRLDWQNKTKRNWNWSCIFTKSTTKIWVLLTHIFGWGGDETRSHKRGTRKDQWVMMAQKKWLSVVQWVWRAKFS